MNKYAAFNVKCAAFINNWAIQRKGLATLANKQYGLRKVLDKVHGANTDVADTGKALLSAHALEGSELPVHTFESLHSSANPYTPVSKLRPSYAVRP